jgi:chromate transporter
VKGDVLWPLAVTFFTTALFSVGGISAMIPEIHRSAVEVHGWMTNAQFAAAFALSQIAPGPNILLMTLIGWRVAGLAGLIVATLATIIPTSAMALIAGRGEKRLQHARWYAMTKRSLPPLVVGLICASALITAQTAIHDWLGVALAVGVAVHVAVSRTNPLIPLFAAVMAGVIAGRLGIY